MANDSTKMKCPGQDTTFWKPGDIFDVTCSNCGSEIEFFKDEAVRRCRKCGTRVRNPKVTLGCAQWCEHAKECLGYDPKAELEESASHGESLADELVSLVRQEFAGDEKRFRHALDVLDNAKEIMREEGGDPKVVVAAALLHDIGIKAAEEKHNSAAPKYQELEGPPIARRILKSMNFDEDATYDVVDIVGNHHSAGGRDTTEFRIVWDADWIVNLLDTRPDADPDAMKRKIDKVFRTGTGRKLAYKKFHIEN